MFVKICGITNREDAHAAADEGAAALGFIFHSASPRFIPPDTLAEWIDDVPSHIWRVGVFVNRSGAEMERVCCQLHLDVAQLHGSESPADIPQGVRVWKAFRVKSELPEEAHDFPAEAVLLDGAGSGRPVDWKLARDLKRRVILAGGLNAGNIATAVEQTHPWGVDACSSLEMYPGKKDRARMARFLKTCQSLISIPR